MSMVTMAQAVYNSILAAPEMGGLFSALVAAVVAIFGYSEIDPTQRPINILNSQILPSYDFIVVGSGSAGNVVVNRLTEISNWTVLLLEAGADETLLSDVPIFTYNLWRTTMDWNYTTVPQPNACRVLENSTCLWPRGRVIGGSSVVNDFAYVRGNRRDYDGWAAMGNPGWSYQEVLPFFIRMEDNRYPPYAANSAYHGVGGYQSVERPGYLTAMGYAAVQSGQQLGYNQTDSNAAQQTGFMIAQGTLVNSTRCSTGRCWLRPIRNRPNLHVAENAHVNRILIGSQNKTAYGVEFDRGGQTFTVYSTKEVILCAGTVNSAQLLMLSGVGPAQELQALGIPVIQNLNVGQNLQDHIGVPMAFTVAPNASVTNADIMTVQSVLSYAINHTGPLVSMTGVEALAFMNNNGPNSTYDYPDSEIVYASYVPGNANNIPSFIGLTFYLHPESRGNITLNSTNPYDPPIINPMYFSVPSDVQNAIKAINNTLLVATAPAFAALNASFATGLFSACLGYPLYSQQYLGCLVQNYSTTIYHPVGTCRMGPASDPTAVVDSRLRVHNITGLRVIDASIMPQITSGNVNAPTIMIGERGSDFIRRDYNVTTAVLSAIPTTGG